MSRKLSDKVMVEVTLKQLANITACVAVVLAGKPADADPEDTAELKEIIDILMVSAGMPEMGKAAFRHAVESVSRTKQ